MNEDEEKNKAGSSKDCVENVSNVGTTDVEDDSDAEKNSEHSSDDEEEDATQGFSLKQIRKWMADKLHVGKATKTDDDQKQPHILNELSMDGVVEYIRQGRAKNIITMVGAGISTSAGIPDFRSPTSGLYNNLGKYNLPSPLAIFDIRYFEKNPAPFFDLAKDLYPKSFNPTPAHYFVKVLHDKGLLLRHYTQNIDMLERVAGLPDDKIVEAHGSFHKGHCLKCNKEYSQGWMKEEIFADKVPTCFSCGGKGGTVKPDIIFFGEQLPTRFFNCARQDFDKCDLLIIMGTSLQVQPFASLVGRVSDECPRVLINRTKAGGAIATLSSFFGLGGGASLDFDKKGNIRDVFLKGDTDPICLELVEQFGWQQQLQQVSQVKHPL